MIVLIIIGLLSIQFIITAPLYKLLRNYHSARKSGLRIIVSPITPYSLQWQLLASLCGSYLQRYRWFRAIDWTCCWQDKDKLHQELGLCFIIVAPGHNVLCTSSPLTIEHLLKEWREFVKPDNVNEILGTFGQNVDTSNGDDWIRHRKLTAPCFSERASATVWSEAIEQSKIMIERWHSSPKGRLNSMIKDTSTLALNVISSVAFENTEVNKPTFGHTLTLRDALVTVMSTSISPAVEGFIPFFKLPILELFLPRNVRKLLRAMHEFRQYMDETVGRERKRMISGETKVAPLISTLIGANDQAKTDSGLSKAGLSDTELRGNIFIFTVGGLESTSITLSYAIALLAVHPDIQDWVMEELDEVLDDGANSNMEYARVFPRLKRVMAVMYETLRLYGPSPPLPRSSSRANSQPTIPVTSTGTKGDARSIILPANTQLMLNAWASQTSSANFSDPLTWNPKRWIQPHHPDTTRTSLSKVLAAEELKHPTSGSGFLAWGTGPRICPGMKFSQVEFCGVLSNTLKSVRVESVCGDDENAETTRQKIVFVLEDSCADPLLLHVRQPEKLELRISKR
ncbi:hypothetical protein G6011_02815 [Alternaria panax]|uniref:Cytochrome P450 n=1 Tax=Alternaria panax TaxID=48097 RepID=A0AAD4FEU7_9PLEO|nr:hypothetical protein G6011_02815 [Alternaria panax]